MFQFIILISKFYFECSNGGKLKFYYSIIFVDNSVSNKLYKLSFDFSVKLLSQEISNVVFKGLEQQRCGDFEKLILEYMAFS